MALEDILRTAADRARQMGLPYRGALTPAETHALCPFDLAHAVPPEQVDLSSVVYEPFRVQRKYARPQAIAGFEQMERSACQTLVPGSARNVHVAVLLEGLVSQPVLLPVWITHWVWLAAVTGLAVWGLGMEPAMIGRSGSPSMWVSMTSVPGWSGKCMPYSGPA